MPYKINQVDLHQPLQRMTKEMLKEYTEAGAWPVRFTMNGTKVYGYPINADDTIGCVREPSDECREWVLQQLS